jgi:hypothetical protein
MPVLSVRECREGSSASDETRAGTTDELKTINIHGKGQNESTRSDEPLNAREKDLEGCTERTHRIQGTEEASDVFGNEEGAEVQYKTMEWWYVSSRDFKLLKNTYGSPVNRHCGICM